jgi:hypothetical protein
MRFLLTLIFFLGSSTILCSARDIAAVVHRANPAKTVALAELAKMAKTSRKWPDGRPVTFVMKDPASPEMNVILQKMFAMNADEVKAMISMNPKSFLIVDSDSDILKVVSGLPNSIGLINIYSITSAVNVMRVDGKLPLEMGYVFRDR